ncbi:MAG: peptide ABC transporter substrate-binding protein [Anaerolineae bacterium]
MSENKWLIGVVAVLLVALLGLVCVGIGALVYCPTPGSVCSGLLGSSSTGGNLPNSTPRSGAANPTAKPPVSSTTNGKVLRLPGGVGGGGDPITLDPAMAGDVDSATYVMEIFSGLVAFDKDLKIVPELAQNWDTSADGKVYTFHLRQDAKFHDGRVVTAQDVKYSIERAANPRTRSTTAPLYLGDITGFNDRYTGKATEVAGVKVVDNYTVEFTLDRPVAYFLAELTYPSSFVVDKNNVEGASQPWYLKPNGTGPFKLKSWEQGQQITLLKNADYYGNPKPGVDEVDLILGGGSSMTLYENGELEGVRVSAADIDRVQDPSNPLNKELSTWPQLSTGFLVFNVKKAPFDDVNVRKAFAMCVDRQKLVTVVAKNMVTPATGILPQAFPGFNQNLQGIPYDATQAKQLIAQSKYAGKLPDITWSTSGSGGTTGPDTQAIAEMLKQCAGANISIEQSDFATYLTQITGTDIQLQMFDIGWSADYADPNDFLNLLFHCGSSQNWSGYCNPNVDKLIDQASVETDNTKRVQLYQQAEQMIMNDAPVLPLTYGKDYWLSKPYVQGFIDPPLIISRLKYISLQK